MREYVKRIIKTFPLTNRLATTVFLSQTWQGRLPFEADQGESIVRNNASEI